MNNSRRKLQFPTVKECKWVTNTLLERNPTLFTGILPNNKLRKKDKTMLKPFELAIPIIAVWMAAHNGKKYKKNPFAVNEYEK